MRNNPTLGEQILWKKLKRKQLIYVFNRQKRLENFIVDFYCHKLSLIIEIDGFSHSSKDDYDLRRQRFLESLGLSVLRFTEKEVVQNIDEVMKRIYWWIEVYENTPSLCDTPLKRGDLE